MIIITLDGTKHEFDEDRLMVSEAIAIKKVAGMGPERIFDGLKRRTCTPDSCSAWDGDSPCELEEHKRDTDPESLKVLVWLAVRRQGEAPRYSEFDFDMATIGIEQVDEPAPEGEPTEVETPDPTTVATWNAP